MNTICYFEIQSSHPAREIDFYRNVFGWEFIRDESVPIEFYQVEKAGLNAALFKRPAKVPPKKHGTNAFTCSMVVKSFELTQRLILKNGGQLAMPMFPIPGKGWQGYFMDADNNVFGIFQEDESAGKK